jgi:hypothetical protein
MFHEHPFHSPRVSTCVHTDKQRKEVGREAKALKIDIKDKYEQSVKLITLTVELELSARRTDPLRHGDGAWQKPSSTLLLYATDYM